MISKQIQNAQKAVEAQNFESRKHLLEYDDVMNKQREAVYGVRRRLLEGLDQRELILEDYVGGILSSALDEFAGENVRPDQWNVKGLDERLVGQFGVSLTAAGIKPEELARHELGDAIFDKLKAGLRGQGEDSWRGDHALPRADGDAERDRRAVEGPPAGDGPLEGGDRAARLCAAGSAGGLQARIVRHVRGDDAEVPGGHGPVPFPDADSGTGWRADGCGSAAAAGGSGSAAGGERGARRRDRMRRL
jgi:hypothetical protein